MPGRISLDRQVALRSVGLQHRCAARGQPGQPLDGRARPFAHHVIERAADQQEEQQRDRGVEIGMRTVMDRLVEAHAEGEQHADRDRHVHVGPAVRAAPARPSGRRRGRNRRGRQGDRRREPVEEVARLGIRARPHGDRQHHDVARGKAGDRKRPHQLASGRRPSPRRAEIVEVGVEARLVQGRDEGRRRIAPPGDRDAPGRQIDARPLDLRAGRPGRARSWRRRRRNGSSAR